ncbi:MAG: hypothetical protein SGBAC_004321 [Bacillariaceae sp.]
MVDQDESKTSLSFRVRRRPTGIDEKGLESVVSTSSTRKVMNRESSMGSLSVSMNSSGDGSGTFMLPGSVTSNGRRNIKASDRITLVSQPAMINPRIQELTINKLKYDSVGLVGREKELTILKECCNQAIREKKKQFISIQGMSGVGKSSLTKPVEEQISASDKGIFGKGKFNLESSTQPYSGLVDALNQLYRAALVVDGAAEEMKKQLSSELGDDVTLLAALIPALETLAPVNFLVRHRSGLMKELYNPEAEQAKWKSAFKVFIRILCQHCSTVVLVLDDLQWADRSTLNMIEDLLKDPFNKESLMIIGTIRSDVGDGSEDALSDVLKNLKRKQKKFKFYMTEIEPQNLNVDDVHRVIMSLLAMDDEEATRGLANVCFKRTLGNPNFVVQFITMLEEEALISFSLGLLKWVWEDRLIEDETMSTENVVDLLQFRMKKLSPDLRLLMQYAACLGSTFDPAILALLWEQHGSSSMDLSEKEPTMKLLSKLEESNFVERDGDYFRWVHNKVQETALEMEEAQKPSFHFEVGCTLLNGLSDSKLDIMLFVVTNLINKSNVKRRLEFAKLNLRAAEKAQRLSAFYNGASYAARTIKLLPDESWKEHRELILNAYTIGAEMEAATGNVHVAEEYCDVILKRDDYTALERYRLYMVKINILCFVKVSFEEAVDFSLDVLKEFGCKLVPNKFLLPVHAVRSIQKTVKLAKKTTRAQYRALQPSDDTILEATMTVLGRMNYACAQGGSPLLLVLSTTKMVNMTLKHGLFSFSGAAQCILGMACMVALGDVKSATYFAETGALMQESIPSKHFVATTMLVSNHLIFPWSSPLASCRPQLLEGYVEGMRTGNVADGIWCLLSYSLFMPMQMGMRLQSIKANVQVHIRVVEDLKQSDHAAGMRMFSETLSDLIGDSDQVTVISANSSGSVLNDEDAAKAKNFRALSCLSKYFSAVYFGDFEEAALVSLTEGGLYRKLFKFDAMGVFESFLRGVALFAMARKTRKTKYRKSATKILTLMTKLMKQGNPNAQPYYTLLSAEQAALIKDTKQAKKLYQETIVYAARTGQLNHAALSNERYSDFLLNELHDSQEAQYRMDEAIRYYKDWGAYAKVDRLKGSSELSH